MITSAISVATLGLVLLWGARLIRDYVVNPNRPRHPPGPKPKPFIGNVLDIPLSNPTMKFLEWGKQYGSDILHIEAFGSHIIILNAVDDAEELLEKRSRIYSDRPVIPMTKLIGLDSGVFLLRHDDKWRLHRRICQQNFREAAAHKYHPLQSRKVHEMLQGLLETPENFENHNKMLSIAIPLYSMYGYEVKSLDDPCIKLADEAVTAASELLLPGGNYIDIIPVLGKVSAWVPGAYSVRAAAVVKQMIMDMVRIPMDHAKERYAAGTSVPSLVTDLLEKKYADGVSLEEEEAVGNIAYTVYGGSSDTTIAATKAFFYYMAINPAVQKKAHDEIDRIVGSERLPDFTDRTSGKMPYIEAIYRELMRISAPLPLGIPHSASEDDVYKGYFIPKGATVIANLWGMGHNDVKYPNPSTFKPERFLDSESGHINDDDRILAYGFGRRVCVGKYVASSTVWLIIVSILACFDIGKAKDDKGEYIEIDDDFEDSGILRHKAKFKCSITVRSPEARQLILNANTTE